jgi:hypothetical protein
VGADGRVVAAAAKSDMQIEKKCASACFLAFAGGTEKYVNYSGKVGVHGVSDENGDESVSAQAATVEMARALKELGVPAGILGKMVTTPPSQILWLSPDDLRSMGTTMVGKPNQTQSSAIGPQVPGEVAGRQQGVGLPARIYQAETNQIAGFLQAEGYSAKLGKDANGDPFISSSSQGAKWEIYFTGAQNT